MLCQSLKHEGLKTGHTIVRTITIEVDRPETQYKEQWRYIHKFRHDMISYRAILTSPGLKMGTKKNKNYVV